MAAKKIKNKNEKCLISCEGIFFYIGTRVAHWFLSEALAYFKNIWSPFDFRLHDIDQRSQNEGPCVFSLTHWPIHSMEGWIFSFFVFDKYKISLRILVNIKKIKKLNTLSNIYFLCNSHWYIS